MTKKLSIITGLLAACAVLAWLPASEPHGNAGLKKWHKGQGWGWVWGQEDEVGSLNEMTDASRLAAVRTIRQGKVYDLGVLYDRTSYKWPGHSPGEVVSFRTPEGVKRQRDLPFADNATGTAWHSCALFINDNVATQIDSLSHATEGDDNHWYNGFREADWGGNWGPRRCDATTIPPIIARGVLIDVAGDKGVDALPAHYPISVEDLRGAIATDTSGLEWNPQPERLEQHWQRYGSFIPVHNYLLIQQGVHIGEFHYLEDLARDRVYEFCYICTTNKIKGSTAGFTLRPIAVK